MKKLTVIFAALVSVTAVVVSLAGCEKKKQVISDVVAAEMGSVTKQILFVGRVRSEQTVLVRAPFEAQLVHLDKTLGSTVAVGDVIASVEEPKNETRQSGLIEDEGRLNQVRLKQAKLQLQIENAKTELGRMSRLVASGSIASGEYQQAKVAVVIQQKEFDSLKAEEKTIQDAIRLKQKSQSSATKTLIAPSAGVITQLWMAEEDITPGVSIPKDTIMATIEVPGKYVIKGDVVEADYLRMKVGQPVDITLVHNPNQTLRGKIKSISPVAKQDQFGIGRFDVTAVFEAEPAGMRAGLEARGEIILEKRDKVLRLPRSAVRERGGEYTVSMPGKEGPVWYPVRPGLIGDQYIEIASGLEIGHQVYQAYVEPGH